MIRVLIAEDQQMLRGALSTLLNYEVDIEVIAQANNGKEAIELIHQLSPDVCLLDIEMPIKSGLDLAEEMFEAGSVCKVIILTTFARTGYFERAIGAGVHGYLLKDGPSEELAEAIRRVMNGQKMFSPELVFNHIKQDNPLTSREKEVLKLVASGLTSKEVSAHLYLSAGTVRNYMSEIINKLEAKNRIEAITKAKEKGWI
ncbi:MULTISPECIES: response regulator transcription factor [Cytobacillus]|uniref:Response regulator transcription factor n=1 Tax=Cytobacillus stercorigallinarum TaxID=2762240 RepID=A0ABR8QRW2_9BACI|nr:response regulator transcription factor [Cytobacillus stercorigallinarum]MBD7938129.1 response regulator transcription factor [Cytobacillus stercorigallinarum]